MQLQLNKIKLPSDSTGIVVNLSYKLYYDTSFTPIASNVVVNADGTFTPVSITINPANKYILRAENLLCGFVYEQTVMLNPYCDPGYILSPDGTYCYKEEIVSATPPANPQVTVEKNNNVYGTGGSFIYNTGFNINGSGSGNKIALTNPFWYNGAGNYSDGNVTNGPVNRAGLWSETTTDNQDIAFSVCVEAPVSATYYVGVACDNYAKIDVDAVNIVTQTEAAINTQHLATGACFKVFHLYPVFLTQGKHILKAGGHNVFGDAVLAVEVFGNTAAEIAAATSYSQLNVIFSTKDLVGEEVPMGSGGIGWLCPSDEWSLSYCDEPKVCKRVTKTTIKY